MPKYPCPCCDYFTLCERGSYLICPVCFWEDDGQDIDELDLESGPNNGLTLREARINFKQFGACTEKMKPNVCCPEEQKRFQYLPRDIE